MRPRNHENSRRPPGRGERVRQSPRIRVDGAEDTALLSVEGRGTLGTVGPLTPRGKTPRLAAHRTRDRLVHASAGIRRARFPHV
jgi:hypothetical protein